MPQYGFPGLRDGDQWCLCAPRWQEAFEAGKAPEVVLEATHVQTLEWCRSATCRRTPQLAERSVAAARS